MSLKNMVRSERVLIEEYALSYIWRDMPSAGFGFPCDKAGNRIPNPGSDDNYALCIAESAKDDGDIIYNGVVDYSRYVREPAYGKCVCGTEVVLYSDYGHGIDCDCGRIYNMSGQELAPRSQWEDRYDEDSTAPYCDEFGYADHE